MTDAPPPSSVLNHTVSQAARGKQTIASARSKVVTRPRTLTPFTSSPTYSARALIVLFCCSAAWAKDEPPSPAGSSNGPPSSGGPHGPADDDARPSAHSDAPSYQFPAGPSGEHRWFPFTRRRPMLASDLFGADPSTPRPEKRSSIFRTPSITTSAFARREDCSPAALGGGKNPEQAAAATSPRARDRGLRIAMPTSPAIPYTLSHNRTPGWDSPWVARSPDSFSHRNIYAQLQNGGPLEEQSIDADATANDCWWPRTGKRARAYLLNNVYVPLVKRALYSGVFPLTAC